MGPLKDLLEKFPIFGEMTDQLNPDEKELGKIEAMYDSMTEKERVRPSLIDDSRMSRIARGSGRKKSEVQELLQKHGMMQQVMGAVGQNPGLLGRIPGFKQLGQLSKLKNMDLSPGLREGREDDGAGALGGGARDADADAAGRARLHAADGRGRDGPGPPHGLLGHRRWASRWTVTRSGTSGSASGRREEEPEAALGPKSSSAKRSRPGAHGARRPVGAW
jgi:hypothetical protein